MYDGPENGTYINTSLYIVPKRVSMEIFMATNYDTSTDVYIVAYFLENHWISAVFKEIKIQNETSFFYFLLCGRYQYTHVGQIPSPFT